MSGSRFQLAASCSHSGVTGAWRSCYALPLPKQAQETAIGGGDSFILDQAWKNGLETIYACLTEKQSWAAKDEGCRVFTGQNAHGGIDSLLSCGSSSREETFLSRLTY